MAFVASPAKPSGAPAIVKVPAQSSFIASFEYDAANLTLTTHLKDGSIYQHKFVTPIDFDLLLTSKSQSKHWANSVKGNKQVVKVKTAKTPNSDIRKGRSK